LEEAFQSDFCFSKSPVCSLLEYNKETTMYSDIPKPIIKKNLMPSSKATSREGVRKNIEWLNKHHREYQGQWVALNAMPLS
jgi:hypothetical protein